MDILQEKGKASSLFSKGREALLISAIALSSTLAMAQNADSYEQKGNSVDHANAKVEFFTPEGASAIVEDGRCSFYGQDGNLTIIVYFDRDKNGSVYIPEEEDPLQHGKEEAQNAVTMADELRQKYNKALKVGN